MSMILMVQALKAKVGNAGRKLVLVKLADNANDKGECWPSYQHIADHCEMGRSTVKTHIKALEAAGFLTVMERNGGKSSNRFKLHISSGGSDGKEGATRSESDPLSEEEEGSLTRSGSDPVRNEPGQDLTPSRSVSDPDPVRIEPTPGQNLTPEPVIEPISEPITESVNSSSSLNNSNNSRVASKGKPTHMTLDWLPPQETVNQLLDSYPGEEQTLNLALINFRSYWHSSGKARSDWAAKFVTSFSNYRQLEIDAEAERHFSKIDKFDSTGGNTAWAE